MAYTETELAVAVLRKLRVMDAAETSGDVEAGVLAIVTDAYTAKWEELTAHGKELTYWPRDEIPRPVFLILRDLIALEVQDAFGMPIAAEEKEGREMVILRKLRAHIHVPSSGRPMMTRPF